MQRISSCADLDRVGRQQRDKLARQVKNGGRIIVGMGTCGIAAGAAAVMKVLRAEAEKKDLPVSISSTGCIGMCEREPLVDVELTAGERITYGNVTPEMARRIVREHVQNRRVIREAALARLTRED